MRARGEAVMENILNLAIEGMHCGACVSRVTGALQSVPGVTVNSVEVGSANVALDTAKATTQDLIAAVERIGFEARLQQ